MSAAQFSAPIRSACLAGLLSLAATLASAQTVPPAATPGGAQPRPAPPPLPSLDEDPVVLPRVPERPLGLDEGPKVRVTRFELIGAATQPDVPRQQVDAVLANAIAAQPEDGYGVNQLQEVADQLAEVYRSHGLILAQAVVPAQEVVGGVVSMLLLEGALGDVRFEGQSMYSPAALGRPFRDLLSRPVRRQSIEEALLYLSEYPGLSAFGVFQAGDRVGTTDLVVQTQGERRATLDTSLDNQGSQFSGEYRATTTLTVNNPLGRADQFRLYGLYAFDPEDSDARGAYGGFDYRLPVAGPKHVLQLGYSHNLFEVGQLLRALNIRGATDTAQLGYTRMLAKNRFGESSLQLSLARKDAEFEQQNTVTAHDVLTVGSLGFNWNSIGVRSRGVTQLNVEYSHGFEDLLGSLPDYDSQTGVHASRLDAGGAFDKVTFQLQRFQRVSAHHALLMRLSGQYSDDLLVSLEQFSMGGADSVRAYPSAEFLADTGGFASLEWVMDAPGIAARPAFQGRTWGQVLKVSLFVDYATGRLNQVLAGEQERMNLSGWGVGLQFNLPQRVFARLDAASAFSERVASNGRDPQYFFRFGFTL